MKTIHKVEIELDDSPAPINIKGLFQILKFEFQRGKLCMWYMFDDSANITTNLQLRIFGTGQPINPKENLIHLATVVEPNNPLVWHIFRRSI